MTTRVEQSIMVNVPVSVAYNQWTQFEDFPQFMSGVSSVEQLSDERLRWVAQIAGVRREWEARILEQVPDRKVSWAATEGATNAGSVEFEDVGGGQTSVRLFLEYEPEGLVEKVGDKLHVVENQAESDLQRFKKFIEAEGYATGAWRGQVSGNGHTGTPGVPDAAASQGDSGKAGVSGKVAAGLGAAAVAGVAAVAATRGGSGDDSQDVVDVVEVEEVDVVVTPVAEAVVVEAPLGAETADTGGIADTPATGSVASGTAGSGTAGGAANTADGATEDFPDSSTPVGDKDRGPMDELYAATDEATEGRPRTI